MAGAGVRLTGSMDARAGNFESIAEHCRELVAAARRLPLEDVTLESRLDALEFDSLDKVSLSFDVEEAYDIDIPDSALFAVKTVGDIARGVHAALEKRGGRETSVTENVSEE